MGQLLDEVLTYDNLHRGWLHVLEKSHMAGSDGETLEDFSRDLKSELYRLMDEVREGRYRARPLHGFVLEEPCGKLRQLAVPAVRDRVLQSALLFVITPIAERRFSKASFGYRPGRSVILAIGAVTAARDRGFCYVLNADIRSCFDSVHRGLLLDALHEWFPDPELVALIECCITAQLEGDGQITTPSRGIAQGAPLSPLLCNVYLTPLDEALERERFIHVRYADNCAVLCRDEAEAGRARACVERSLTALKLELNRNKTQLVTFDEGFRFLGMWLQGDSVTPAPNGAAGPPLLPAACMPTAALAQRVCLAQPAVAEPAVQPTAPDVNGSATVRNGMGLRTSGDSGQAADVTTAAPEHVEGCGLGSQGSIPDPVLRTLYLTEAGWYLRKDSERLVVRHNDTVLLDVPARDVDQVVAMGHGIASADALSLCLTQGIPIFLLTPSGHLKGAVDSHHAAGLRLQRVQFERAADPEFTLRFAQAVAHGKLRNMALLLQRYTRRHDLPDFADRREEILRLAEDARDARDLDALRGYEGSAARAYFAAWRNLFAAHWGFQGRERAPPPDPVNCMLSFGYTMLYHNLYCLIRRRGLNPHVGFLHVQDTSHAALASDLMEEFRPLAVDALVLNLLINNHVQLSDFASGQSGDLPCVFKPEAKRRFIRAFEAKVDTPAEEADEGVPPLRRLMQRQVSYFADLLLGKVPHYEPALQR